jgi:hypothetical protein
MSQIHGAHIGPFAEWHLTAEEDILPDKLHALLHDGEHVLTRFDHGEPPRITLEGIEYVQVCWAPYLDAEGSGAVPRRFRWSTLDAAAWVLDLRGIDPDGEIKWFQRTYRRHLAALTRHYKKSPRLSWGVNAA